MSLRMPDVRMRYLALAPACAAFILACGPREEAAAPEPAPVASEPPSAPEPEAPAEPLAPAEPEAAPEAPPAEATPVELEPICQAKCDRLASRCTPSAVETCRAGCDQWKRIPEPCNAVTEAALTCARDASDLVCSPVVPESCGRLFFQVATCKTNPDGFEFTPVQAESARLPAGWERVEDPDAGFAVAMPSGATLDTARGKTWRSTHANGVPFSVRVLAPLNEQPDAKGWIRLAADTLAPCDLGTRLHGLIDKPDFLAMRYDSKCKGGGERHGTLYVLPKAFVVTAIEGPMPDDAETFLFGLEPR